MTSASDVDHTNGDDAWRFYADSGGHVIRDKANPSFAWAMHAGDVGVAVPEPQTRSLMLLGLAVAAMARRSRCSARARAWTPCTRGISTRFNRSARPAKADAAA